MRRTFIEPAQSIRHFGVKVKHNAVSGMLEGKRVVLVDDSIVRGTTLVKIVSMLRDAGAREVHVRISSPPTIGPCHYGIDTPTREELIAHQHTPDEIRLIIGADSLGYLSLEGLRQTARAAQARLLRRLLLRRVPGADRRRAGAPAALALPPRRGRGRVAWRCAAASTPRRWPERPNRARSRP